MENLDTFLTTLYVMVDDVCKQHQLWVPTHPGPSPKLSRCELITLAIFGQWYRFSSERNFTGREKAVHCSAGWNSEPLFSSGRVP